MTLTPTDRASVATADNPSFALPDNPLENLLSERRYRIAAALIILLGVAVRGSYVLASSFPLNDGGLFYEMAQDLRRNGYALPWFTSYNGGHIPFAYPPLGFYLSDVVAALTSLSLLQVYQYLPLLLSCLLLPAFLLLARSMLPSRTAQLAAVAAFALLPRSFIWLLMGGGVTRSLGLLFAILALHTIWRLARRPGPGLVLLATVLCALTILSHIETGWFLCFSGALLLLSQARDRVRALVLGSCVALGTIALTLPWWATIVQRHGLDAFLAASATGGSVFSDGSARVEVLLGIVRISSTSEPLFPLITMLALLGAGHTVLAGRWLLVIWWAAIVVLDLRAYPTFTTLPVALLAGIGFAEVVVPALQHLVRSSNRPDGQVAVSLAVLVALLLGYATAGAVVRSDRVGGENLSLAAVSSDERFAMGWIASTSSSNSRYLLIPTSSWETARTLEWFPVLARRVSVATVQGSEWLPRGAFERSVDAYYEAEQCGYEPADCLERWSVETGEDFTDVYIAKYPQGQCCATLLDSLATDTRYRLTYDGPGATVYRRITVPLDGEPAAVGAGQSDAP